MLQVLARTFQVLELVAAEPERDFPLGEIARALTLHPATCSHIVKSLAEGGYLEQDAPGKGYRLGPKPYALTRGGAYRKDLVARVRPALEQLAADLAESVEFSVLRGTRRVMITHVDGCGAVRVREGVVRDDNPWATASGRLLAAQLPPAARERLIASAGLPGDAWPGVLSRRALEQSLDAIAAEGRGEICKGGEVVGVAYAVRQGPDGPVAGALGLHLPSYRYEGNHKKRIHAALAFAAAQLSISLGAQAPERKSHQ